MSQKETLGLLHVVASVAKLTVNMMIKEMDYLVLLSLTEMGRKRKLHEVGETFQVDSWRLDDWISLAKCLQEVLGNSVVCVGLICMANLGTRLVAFGGGGQRHC